jgi:hypothetical protein
MATACSDAPAASQFGALTITANGQTPGAGEYYDGQTINLSAGANSIFHKNLTMVILECADPGGLPSNLPRNESVCDGDTENAPLPLINNHGGWSNPNYQIFKIPSLALGEAADTLPKCDATHYCVLYIGEDQSNFSKPKIFSPPFLVENRK